MSRLHTVNKSPFTSNCLASCLRLASLGDGILLIEDGVYAALINSDFSANLAQATERFTFYALGPDLQARGVIDQVCAKVQIVDYRGFVELATQYAKVQAWF
jgi:tRNA 2-thiouridine synthesizing protein B